MRGRNSSTGGLRDIIAARGGDAKFLSVIDDATWLTSIAERVVRKCRMSA